MVNVETIVAIVGGIAFLVGLFGGGVKAKEILIPRLPAWSRTLSCIVGLALMGEAIWLTRSPATVPNPAQQPSQILLTVAPWTAMPPALAPSATILPTSIPQIIIPTATALIAQPSATPQTGVVLVQTVRDYYSAINDGRYTVTWAMLSDHFKETHNSPQKGGYAAYVKWWDSVARVDVGKVSVVKQTGDLATVFAELSYVKNGKQIDDTTPYIQLIFDPTAQEWLFYDKGSSP